MSGLARSPHSARALRRPEFRGKPLGQILVSSGRLAQTSLDFALDLQRDTGGPLGHILVAHHFNSTDEITEALAAQSGQGLALRDPDHVIDIPGAPEFWISAGLHPWARTKHTWKIAAKDPKDVARHHDRLTALIGDYDVIWASHEQIQAAQMHRFRDHLQHTAENSVCADLSCRTYSPRRMMFALLALAGCVATAAIATGSYLLPFHVALGLAVFGLILSIILKGWVLATPDPLRQGMAKSQRGDIWPTISILVPLFHETKIAERLIERIKMLDYPRSHLDVILLLEISDPQTRDVLTKTALPAWIRVIEVPIGTVQTKPRAMNYALPFCKGDIIGIYDAEDAPEPDQLIKVATQFATCPPDTVCLQGRLDFYNTHSNWIARCFTIEYNSWFRMILPRLAHMGGVIPLGGTTLFFRKSALVALGGWDAHNVTEDADLGVRLARAGYRCAILDSTTFEEANNRPYAWVKQRSRWLKGYAITYLVHMRRPRQLWRDLGAKKFFLFQLVFLTTLIGFSIAPVFWVLWMIAAGWPSYGDLGVSVTAYRAISCLCLISFFIELVVNTKAVNKSGHIALRRWIVTTVLYFPLGTIAMYKAAWEMITAPFYWDKTDHGAD